MKLNVDVLQEFEKITSINIEAFLRKSLSFFSQEYNTIVAYYNGDMSSISSKPFEIFEELKKECGKVFETIQLHGKRLNNIKWWLLIEQVEDIDSRLKGVSNMSKWCKTSVTKTAYDTNVSVQYTLKQNQNLERVASDILGSNDSEKWVDIALKNNLREEDYSTEGGVDIQLQFAKINQGFKMDSVY